MGGLAGEAGGGDEGALVGRRERDLAESPSDEDV